VHRLLQRLGATRYHLAAHDIGAWVAYPYAALFEAELRSLALLDAGIPGVTLPDALPFAPDRAWRTWHFAFHVLADLPEFLIQGRERDYLGWFLRRKSANPETFLESDPDEYSRVLTKAGGLRAGLAYYRSAALSASQNRELSVRGRLNPPLLAVGSDQGSIVDMAAPLREFWQNSSTPFSAASARRRAEPSHDGISHDVRSPACRRQADAEARRIAIRSTRRPRTMPIA